MLQGAELDVKPGGAAAKPPSARRVIFISHATPQDNVLHGGSRRSSR